MMPALAKDISPEVMNQVLNDMKMRSYVSKSVSILMP